MNLLALFGGGLPKVLLQAYQAKLDAQNSFDRIEADLLIQRIEAARAISLAEAGDRFSATRLGRLLIVVPFGVWWTAIFIVSTFHLDFIVLALPPAIMEMAKVLIPAILIADVIRTVRK